MTHNSKLDTRNSKLARSGVPSGYLAFQLQDYDPKTPSQDEAFRAAVHFLVNLHANFQAGAGMIFTGDVGAGKTHLAVGLMASILERSPKLCKTRGALFLSAQETINGMRREISLSPRKKPYTQLFESAFDKRFLLLDDWGKERLTPWVMDEVYCLLSHRHSHRLMTIITSNSSLADIRSAYNSQDLNSHTAGTAIVSRLRERNKIFTIHGPDGRRNS